MYSVHPSIAYIQAIVKNLPQKTGKSLDEWLVILEQSGLKNQREQRLWLKNTFGVGDTTAGLLAEYASGNGIEREEKEYLDNAHRYVEDMFAGPKEPLRPLYESLLRWALSLYPAIKISPCKTIVPFYRNHVIAQIKPSTRTRIDFGLSLRDLGGLSSNRLIETGGLTKGDRITHRIAIHSSADIDEDLAFWLKRAYELDSGS